MLPQKIHIDAASEFTLPDGSRYRVEFVNSGREVLTKVLAGPRGGHGTGGRAFEPHELVDAVFTCLTCSKDAVDDLTCGTQRGTQCCIRCSHPDRRRR